MKIAEADRLISEELRAIADELNERLEQIAGQKMSFSLLIFNTEPGSRMNYISNCQRDDVHAALKADGFVVYAGQGDFSKQIFRIAHMGDIHEDDLVRLEESLRRCFSP